MHTEKWSDLVKRLKSLLCFLLSALLIVLALCSCTPMQEKEDDTVLSLTEKNVSHKFAQYTITDIVRTDFITTQHPPTYLSYYNIDEEGYEYLDIIVSLKNISKESVEANKLLDISVIIGEMSYETKCIPEIAEGTDFYDGGSMLVEPDETVYVHYFVRIESHLLEGNVTLKATSGENIRTIKIARNDITLSTSKELFAGDVFNSDLCSVKILSFDSAARIQPENAGKAFNFYEVSEKENVLFIVNTEITNTSDEKLCVDNVMGMCIKEGLDLYFATSVVENEQKTDYITTAATFIEPDQSIFVTYIMEVPFASLEDGTAIELYSHGNRYLINY